MPVSRQTESRFGPSHCGQSSAISAGLDTMSNTTTPNNFRTGCMTNDNWQLPERKLLIRSGTHKLPNSQTPIQHSPLAHFPLILSWDMANQKLDTSQKALQINLDAGRYGTFAEIGAGQEVARWFFRAGGAAGTVAKTISAYDMAVSDAIYGPTDRYVSRRRLRAMLDYEYNLLLERLQQKRGGNTAFFVFANTVV